MVTVKYGGVVPSCLLLPEQVVGKCCLISHHSLQCVTEHHEQTLVRGSPVKTKKAAAVPGLLCCGSDAMEPMMSRIAGPDVCGPCFDVPRWSQRAEFHCVAPELKLHPPALLCIN